MAKASLRYDLLDAFVNDANVDIKGPLARHSLVFSKAWELMYGVKPPSSLHHRFCDSAPPGETFDLTHFVRFVAQIAMYPVISPPNGEIIREYEGKLKDPNFLEYELKAKIVSRYGEPWKKYEHLPLEKAHSLLRANADMNEIPSDRNTVTGHHYGSTQSRPFAPSNTEAWRDAFTNDVLFAHRAASGACVFLDGNSPNMAGTAAIAADQLSKAGNQVTVMSNCQKTLDSFSKSLKFYHYKCCINGENSYNAMPKLFKAFVLFGNWRPPLCMTKGKCWHYVTDSSHISRDESAYSVITDFFEKCIEYQNKLNKLVYLIPLHVELFEESESEKRIPVGIHEKSVQFISKHIQNYKIVTEESASRCDLYVASPEDAGVTECMMNGGVVVCKHSSLVDDSINGFLAYSTAGFDNALRKAFVCNKKEVGRSASYVNLIKGTDTQIWLWKGLLSRGCPLQTGNPRDAASLHERYMMISSIMRWRQISRHRATTALRRGVFFMDNRPDPGGALAVGLTLSNLRSGWGLIAFVTEESKPYYERAFEMFGSDVEFVCMDDYHKQGFFIEQYNAKMKSLETWLEIAKNYDTVLTVQNDGILVRPGLESMELEKYEYVGAPWKHHPYLYKATGGNLVGNGGFSFRSVGAMLEVCRRFASEKETIYHMAPPMSEAEDVYFARRVKLACPHVIAEKFAMEQHPSPAALGYHRFWAYHPVEFTARYFEHLLGETAKSAPSVGSKIL